MTQRRARRRLITRHHRRALVAGSFGALLALLAACSGSSDPGAAASGPQEVVEVDFATFLGEDTPQSTTMKWWADEVNARSDGRIVVTAHYTQSLLQGTEMLQGVGDGRAEIGWIGNFYHPSELPLSSVAELPFVSENGVAQAAALFDLYQNYEPFRDEYRKNNIHIAYIPSQGVNTIGTNETQIDSLEDLQGLSIRASGLTSAAIGATGANPIALAAPEIYESAQRGVVDGYSTITLEVLPAFGLEEVTEYLSEAGTGTYILGVMGMNLDFYESLDEDLKAVVDEVSQEAQTRAIDDLVAAQDAACVVMKDAGVTVTAVDDSFIEEWRTLAPDFQSTWITERAELGLPAQEFFDRYSAALTEYESELEFEDGIVRCAE